METERRPADRAACADYNDLAFADFAVSSVFFSCAVMTVGGMITRAAEPCVSRAAGARKTTPACKAALSVNAMTASMRMGQVDSFDKPACLSDKLARRQQNDCLLHAVR